MFCKYCGKEIKDGVRFCPMCGKPTGINKEKSGSSTSRNSMSRFKKDKRPNLKWTIALIGGVAGVMILFSLVVGIVKKLPSSSQPQHENDSSTDVEYYAEEKDVYVEKSSDAEDPSDTENLTNESNDDEKWTKKKSYKKAYEEEYASYEDRLKEYCNQKNIEYKEKVDDVTDSLNEAYKSLEKEVPDLSTYIGLDVGNAVSDSFTGVGIVSALTEKAVSNEEVRKIGFKTMIYAGTALYDLVMNYTTTEYPFGFQVLKFNEDYALLRSNGTYSDMVTFIRDNTMYEIKAQMLQERITELDNTAITLQNEGDDDAYAECMGRLAANKDIERELNETINHYMTVIACSGNGYWLEEEIKLYWLVGKDGSVYHTFWAPDNTNISLCENGSCLLERQGMERFVIDKNGVVIFEGNTFEEREEEPVGESIICAYGPSGNALRETKVKDSTHGTYYVIELVKQNGETEKLLETRKMSTISSGYYLFLYGGFDLTVSWEDYMYCSDYVSFAYESLENQQEGVVIDLNTGDMYGSEFDESIKAEAMKEYEDDKATALSGTLKDGWLWNAQEEKIFVHKPSIYKQEVMFSGLSTEYYELFVEFDEKAFLESIGESRDIVGCYCQDNLLWIVTRSGYFYTYNLENNKKTEEVYVGENAPYAFTPYGLVVQGESGKNNADVKYDSNLEEENKYSIYQYDSSGKCIAKYPSYSENISNMYDYVHGFLYCNGNDSYNLATQKIFSL